MTFATFADRDSIEAEMPWSSRDVPKTLYGLLSRTAERFPDRPAVSYQIFSGPKDKAETLSWRTLRERTTQAANLFRSLGVGEEDVVAYVLPNCHETTIALLGGATAGIVMGQRRPGPAYTGAVGNWQLASDSRGQSSPNCKLTV